MLSAMAEGADAFRIFLPAQIAPAALTACGSSARSHPLGGDTVEVEGCAGTLTPPGVVLDCGNSGSTMRMLSGLLAGQAGEFTLEGTLAEPQTHGAGVQAAAGDGRVDPSAGWPCAGRD